MAPTSVADSTMLPGAPDDTDPLPAPGLLPGTKVEVRRRFDGKWARGFEVTTVGVTGYRLRRLSDGEEMPVEFPADDVRREKKNKTWWY